MERRNYMTNTSIGFHTFTIFMRIDGRLATELYNDFEIYRNNSKEVNMYIPKDELDRIRTAEVLQSKGVRTSTKPRKWRIDYVSDDKKGISWILYFHNSSREYKEYIIEARINPKILAGIKDYIRAADSSYMKRVEERFNEEAKLISHILGEFSQYKLNRIDFCINFDLKELSIKCTPEQMMKLIKMGDYSSHFTEWMKHENISHRMKSGKHSHYLKSGSVNINCYYKYKQFQKEDPTNPSLVDSLHVIRFEVQCKYRKVYSMSQIIKRGLVNNPIISLNEMNEIVSDMTSQDMIHRYFNQIIKSGDYYTLKEAIQIIESEHLRPETEQNLIDTLKEINRTGIAKARIGMNEGATKHFHYTLCRLADLGINPVTIPKSFGIKHIPNLLDTFYKLRESGVINDYNLVDPYDTLDEPFEEIINNKYEGLHDEDDHLKPI